ncbi:MAG: isoprenylcysteine carboxylmethyltransferase family protein [Armatimonadota bacterium]|jgi:protein-S-isoprenylcysteine O-methyltransferase Ste14
MGRLRRTHIHFLLALAALVLAHPRPVTNIIGTVLCVVGIAVRVWAAGVLEKGGGLCTDGPYRWVRHPLYFGSSMVALGLCVMANSLWGWAVILPAFAALYWAQAVYEEGRLRDEFGEDHERYARSVPMIVPAPPRVVGSGRAWQLARVVKNREHFHVLVTCLLVVLFYLRHLLPRV